MQKSLLGKIRKHCLDRRGYLQGCLWDRHHLVDLWGRGDRQHQRDLLHPFHLFHL